MERHPLHPGGRPDPGRSRSPQGLSAATCAQPLRACDDDDYSDEDWDGFEGDPVTDPTWDPLGLDDDDDDPQPEYGDFWDDPHEFED